MASLFSLELGGNWRCRKEMRSTILKTGKGRKKGGGRVFKDEVDAKWLQMTRGGAERMFLWALHFRSPHSTLFFLNSFGANRRQEQWQESIERHQLLPQWSSSPDRVFIFSSSQIGIVLAAKKAFSLSRRKFFALIFFSRFWARSPTSACVRACGAQMMVGAIEKTIYEMRKRKAFKFYVVGAWWFARESESNENIGANRH